jgi:hypothetical protein
VKELKDVVARRAAVIEKLIITVQQQEARIKRLRLA